jgi:protein-S-isoprenylcysteine O-methyltransferase Ste14
MRLLRHLLAILLLPFTVVVVVPTWLLTSRAATDTRWDSHSCAVWIAGATGGLVFLAGFLLFAWCVSLFARVGQGTLAPWDPTQRLVAVGPYRHVRNPMISGVVAMLTGEALISGSRAVALWAMTFVVVNHVYFLVSEEPGLRRRFGESYRTYSAAVPRWVPRRTPWEGE